ncbi:N-acetylneuraminate epimerase precursor [Anatilimnocola aggregata]|uniref:N-acetylneuraminate epimerase n=1 Tax=Anatilimnocola aggregata TaxID=2528021 RepID=A0A517YCI6_9BACT|nr:kelch repeat-containing protein [Anatilimnocola aggregata]QDU27953.1 N-acetylneuraminate epimerase precursor [Anatilimnocola aggregata]
MLSRSLGLLLGLVAAIPAIAADAWVNPMPYPPLPEAISSFGATVSGDHIYVFSGHMGRVPGNSTDGLSPHFSRLNLREPNAKWEELALLQPSQSPGLVAWKGAVYRVGGLSFTNKAGEETSFNSLPIFAKYDPASNTWKELAALPEPRSSLDAAVVGDKLYVVGGWNLQGASSMDAPWHEEAYSFDLTKENGQWQAIAKPPFQTRALAAAAHQGKLWVLGGMHSTNKITRDVHIYDPQTNTWTAGPELPGGDQLAGFAISAFATGGKLFYNGSEGIVYTLKADGSGWEAVERLMFPRSFHRLVPANDTTLVAIAGVARGGGYLSNVEAIRVNTGNKPQPKLAQWLVPFAGTAKHSQILLLSGSSLYTFGGNKSRSPHNFSKEMFSNEVFRFDLAARSVEQLPHLPQGLQSGAAFLSGSRVDQSIYILGGLGFVGNEHKSLDTIYQYRLRSKAWAEEVQHLPGTRAMFNTAAHNGTLWIFGGAEVNTGKGLVSDTLKWKPTAEEPAEVVAAAAIPTPRRSFGGATIGDKYYVVGGLGEKGSIVGNAAVFDLQESKWADIASPKIARVFPNLIVVAGKLYLAGGFTKVDGHFMAVTEVEIYDPAANAWETMKGELPLKGKQLIEYQGRLLFFGVDEEKEGIAHFALLDLSPESTFVASPLNFGGGEGESTAELLTRLLKLDKNKDGKITKDEVGPRFLPIIEKVDADKDGVATKEEVEAYIRKQTSAAGASPRANRN